MVVMAMVTMGMVMGMVMVTAMENILKVKRSASRGGRRQRGGLANLWLL